MIMSLPPVVSDFIPVNSNQLRNWKVVRLAKFNIANLVVSVGSGSEKKPNTFILYEGDLLAHVKMELPQVYNTLEDNPIAILIVWMLNPEPKSTILEKAFAVGYYLAGNGITITIREALNSVMDIARQFYKSGNTLLLHSISDVLKSTVSISLENVQEITYNTSVPNYIDAGGPTAYTSNGIEIPLDLIQHLSNQGSIYAAVRETLRLQELSPEEIRRRNPAEALVYAWKTLH